MQRPNLVLTDDMMKCLNHIRAGKIRKGEAFNRSAFVESALRNDESVQEAAKSLRIKFDEEHRFGVEKNG